MTNIYSQFLPRCGSTEIGRYCKIRRAIIDKEVKVPQGTEIGYDLEDDRKRFFVSDGGVVVIARGTKLSFTKREPIRIQKVIDYVHPQGVANWS